MQGRRRGIGRDSNDSKVNKNMPTKKNHTRKQKPPAGRCLRFAIIALATLLPNATLIVCLASQHDDAPKPTTMQIRTIPAEIAKTPDRKFVTTEHQSHVEIECEIEEIPPCPTLEALALDMPDAPTMPSVQSASITNQTPLFGFANTSSINTSAKPATGPGRKPLLTPASNRKPCFTSRPVLLEPPNLETYYPARAKMRGIAGQTKIRLTINAKGCVTKVAIVSSTPAGIFETAAKNLGRSLRFQPAKCNGKPVAAAITLNLKWELEY